MITRTKLRSIELADAHLGCQNLTSKVSKVNGGASKESTGIASSNNTQSSTRTNYYASSSSPGSTPEDATIFKLPTLNLSKLDTSSDLIACLQQQLEEREKQLDTFRAYDVEREKELETYRVYTAELEDCLDPDAAKAISAGLDTDDCCTSSSKLNSLGFKDSKTVDSAASCEQSINKASQPNLSSTSMSKEAIKLLNLRSNNSNNFKPTCSMDNINCKSSSPIDDSPNKNLISDEALENSTDSSKVNGLPFDSGASNRPSFNSLIAEKLIEKNNKDLLKYRSDIDDLVEELEKSQRKEDVYAEKVKKLEQDLKGSNVRLRSTEQQIDSLETDLSVKSRLVEKLEGEINGWKKKFHTIKAEMREDRKQDLLTTSNIHNNYNPLTRNCSIQGGPHTARAANMDVAADIEIRRLQDLNRALEEECSELRMLEKTARDELNSSRKLSTDSDSLLNLEPSNSGTLLLV